MLLCFARFASVAGSAQAASVALEWNPSPSDALAGYSVYSGTQSGVYTEVTFFGDVTNATITSLLAGVTYFIAVTATDLKGFESDFSNEVSYTVPSLTLAEALNTAGWRWTTGGSTAPWYPQTSLTQDGVSAVRSGALGNMQTNWIETVVTGPGTLSFWWKVSSEANFDLVRFFINGVLQDRRSGQGDWVQASYVLGAGAQTLRWDYRKDQIVSAGQDAAWVDQVGFVPDARLTVTSSNPGSGVSITASPRDNKGLSNGVTGFSRTYTPNTAVTLTAPATAGGNTFQKWQRNGSDWVTTLSTTLVMDVNCTMTAVYQSLAEALNTAGWTWTTGGSTAPWYPQTSLTQDGVSAVRSGALGNIQTNWIETVVTGPGTLSFWWKVSSEANYDFVRFFINGVLQDGRSGQGDWVQASYVLEAGAQTLRWDYRKDQYLSAGQDAAWLDQVRFVPGANLTVTSSNPGGGVSITASPRDNTGLSNGVTGFTRTYAPNTAVTLTAPATAGGNTFQKWQRNGSDWVTTLSTTLVMDVNCSMTAVYHTLAEALNTAGWIWTTGGSTAPWYPQTSLTQDGVSAVRSGALGNMQTNWIETVVTGPGALSFWWKVSSEANFDFVRFFINGVLQDRRSGQGDWVQASYVLGAGAQTLRWDYRKDQTVSAGQDAAWLDRVGFALIVRTALSLAPDVSSRQLQVTISKLEDGLTRLLVTGASSQECRILASDNLIEWTEIGHVTLGVDGLAGFIDASRPLIGSRFYQAVMPRDDQNSPVLHGPHPASR